MSHLAGEAQGVQGLAEAVWLWRNVDEHQAAERTGGGVSITSHNSPRRRGRSRARMARIISLWSLRETHTDFFPC